MATIYDPLITQITAALTTTQTLAGVPTDAAQITTLTAANVTLTAANAALTTTNAAQAAEITKVKADLAQAVKDAP
jgi:hypothetical protein